MKTLYADYNAATEAGHVCLTTRGSREDIERSGLGPGDWAWLSDTEVVIGARLAIDNYYGLVGIPDWETLVHLDDEEAHNFPVVLAELHHLFQKSDRSAEEEARVLELLVIVELIGPPEERARFLPGYLPRRRAFSLATLGKYELALRAIEEALAADPGSLNARRLFLEILRHVDLDRAVREAEALVEDPNVPAVLLAECLNVLATQADDLPDEPFQPVGRRILDGAERFDRAPGRDRVPAATLALLQFNRGMTLLRLGRHDEARQALGLAHAVDPASIEIAEAAGLGHYDQHAREIAARIRARLPAA